MSLEELREKLDTAQQEYNNAWAKDIGRGYDAKIRHDLLLEETGCALESARDAYNKALLCG